MSEEDILLKASVIAPPQREAAIHPSGPRKRRCSAEARAFMLRALRELEKVQIPKVQNAPEIKPTLEVPVQQFSRIGLNDKERIVETLQACPESYYVSVGTSDDRIALTLQRRMNQ